MLVTTLSACGPHRFAQTTHLQPLHLRMAYVARNETSRAEQRARRSEQAPSGRGLLLCPSTLICSETGSSYFPRLQFFDAGQFNLPSELFHRRRAQGRRSAMPEQGTAEHLRSLTSPSYAPVHSARFSSDSHTLLASQVKKTHISTATSYIRSATFLQNDPFMCGSDFTQQPRSAETKPRQTTHSADQE